MQEKQKIISDNREIEWDIESIIRDVLRQWWVILLVAIAAAALTGAYVKMTYQPQYSTTTTFVVGRSGFSSNAAADNLNSAKSMTERLSQIMQSSILKGRVCEKLGLESFDADINISVLETSNLMTLTVKTKSPMLSYQMIHAVMDEVTVLSGELMENISVRVIQEPEVPMNVSNPLNVKREMKMAVLLAAFAMALIFAVLSYYKDTVKNEGEMSKKIDARLLGTIYHERKHKTLRSWMKKQVPSLCIDRPGLSFGYVESVKMLATRIHRLMDKEGKKILMVTSVSENEGKSTIAANIALALAQEDHSVILVDCDFRKPSQYKIFELPEEERKHIDLGLLLRTREPIKIKTAGIEKKLKVLFGVRPHKRMMNREVAEYLATVLNTLKEETDYIIVDSSPMALVAESEIIANLADASLVVVQQDVIEACYINDTIDQLNRTKGKVLGCVYNNVRAGLIGKSREYGHYYGKYGHGYDYSRYGYYGKKTKQSNRSKKQEE